MNKDQLMPASAYQPSDRERMELGQVLGMPGWGVIQKIAVASCAEFRELVFKLNPLDKDYAYRVVELTRQAAVAQTVWEGMARRIELQEDLLHQPKPKGAKPTAAEALPDITEEM